jgi:hypothetical protein
VTAGGVIVSEVIVAPSGEGRAYERCDRGVSRPVAPDAPRGSQGEHTDGTARGAP